MAASAITPRDDHFVNNPDLDILSHRPHKAAALIFNAMTATALFTIWPHLLFFGGWAAMVCCVNVFTAAEMVVPNTLLTALGVLLGLTLSYRTSSAYDRYWEGRRMWSQIILTSRNWARLVWVHCPDSLSATPPVETEERELDRTKAEIEKATIVRMALAFSVAVKHYLRGEEGILYEDLYDLVRFIPSLNMPSGNPCAVNANNASGLPDTMHLRRSRDTPSNLQSESQESFGDKVTHLATPPQPKPGAGKARQVRPQLHPARDPPRFRWSETFIGSFFVSKRQRMKAEGRKARKERIKADRQGGGVGANVPLEITMFMSSWLAAMQRRKTIDVPTTNALLLALQQMGEALSALERILTTPIPWSYNAHIWGVTLIYCLLLPFQLYGSGFGWLTIPAVGITSYIVIGFAAIGAEIENPFGYDKNDLNLDFFTSAIIAQELAAITARPFPPPDEWVFSPDNETLGVHGVGADQVLKDGLQTLRVGLKSLGM